MFLSKSNFVSLGTLNNACRNICLLLGTVGGGQGCSRHPEDPGQTPPQRTACPRMSTVLRLRSLQVKSFCILLSVPLFAWFSQQCNILNFCLQIQTVHLCSLFQSATVNCVTTLSISPDGWL